MMHLPDLLDELSGIEILEQKDGPVEITGLTADSRAVGPGYLFAALPGTKADGLAYVPQALTQGAVAVLIPANGVVEIGGHDAAVLRADNPRQALAHLAARFYAKQPGIVAAVTGTNGKTSVAGFVRQLWSGTGHLAASMGTLGVVSPKGVRKLRHTTPDPVEVHQVLADLATEHVGYLALEASSHGLAQYRLDGVQIRAAAFTNLTRDHLDYHGTFEAYRDAKLRLFTDLLSADGVAVINMDDPAGPVFRDGAVRAGRPVLSVGKQGEDLVLQNAAPTPNGLDLSFVWKGRAFAVSVPLFGSFQASNVIVALGLTLALGADIHALLPVLPRLKGAPGRMDHVGSAEGPVPVFVDYAHTPDALETVLKALRPHVSGRLHVVFGCGGDRDRGKRPQMGEIAVRLADSAIVTDDNPRSEDPAAIRRAVLDGAKGAREIGDRAEAIRAALKDVRPGDVLVVAGKGHETGQIVGDTVHPFSDAEEIKSVLAGRGRDGDLMND